MDRDHARPFESSFEIWLTLLDAWLLLYVGLVSVEWPFKPEIWRLLWSNGWGAQTVADVIAGWMYEAA